jgi:monoamine oxidase
MLILGAGVAGLAAGRILAKAGLRVAVIEARQRVGGRIFTTHASDSAGTRRFPVELGAEFIHGLPQETWTLLREARLESYQVDGVQLCSSGGRLQRHDEQCEGGMAVLEDMVRWLATQPANRDMTFAEYLRLLAVDAGARARAIEYVEGFNVADSTVIGIAALAKQQQAEDQIDTGRLFHVRQGYDMLPKYLAQELESASGTLLLGKIAQRIAWRRGAVSIHGVDDHGNAFTLDAHRALISVPLGVLQAGSLAFTPAPGEILSHAETLKMGPVRRLTMLFHSRFWSEQRMPKAPVQLKPGLDRMSFLFTHGALPSTWWTPMPDHAPMITAWTGGPNVDVLEDESRSGANPSALLGRCLMTLANAFGLPVTDLEKQLVSSHTHDWQADRYARGAYSYAPAGGIDASAAMTEPVERTLYFAGEHTDISGHWGTVHGALRSGIRAATQLLQTG